MTDNKEESKPEESKKEETKPEESKQEEQKPEEPKPEEPKPSGKAEKKVRKALSKLGMTKMEGINRVTMKQKDSYILYVKDPEVFTSSQNSNSFIIFGELTFEDHERKLAQETIAELKKEGEKLKTVTEKKEEPKVEVEEVKKEEPKEEPKVEEVKKEEPKVEEIKMEEVPLKENIKLKSTVKKEDDTMDMPEVIQPENADKKIEVLREDNKAKTEETDDKDKGKCACFIF